MPGCGFRVRSVRHRACPGRDIMILFIAAASWARHGSTAQEGWEACRRIDARTSSSLVADSED
jgi:hypothetical protein